ncbi:glycosyltransferase family 4 protein [Flavicella sp.]|uniref:glycosyltransferase family 4 protein n=1 Tax=Flavicella sp. TaxID=2957742 RepID=UPI0030193252
MQKRLLIIGSVWPEPNSSAAGTRMMQLIDVFLGENYKIIFATSTSESEYRYPLEELGILIKRIALNNKSFDIYIKELEPELVLFDRFMTEEQFGWKVEKYSPKSIRILDTEDLHCLRKGRQQAFKEKRSFSNEDLHSELAKREIASIYRSDLSLMISDFEMGLLQSYFKVPENLLCYIPFLLEPVLTKKQEGFMKFGERSNFVTIGSFRHKPNWDSILYLKNEIWPVLRKKLPHSEMHIYGSYPQEKAMKLHKPADNFFIKGWVNNASEVLETAKVVLAPLRFGAGLKGKFIDAMLNGTPNITTAIGAEAMHENTEWSGLIADDTNAIIAAAEKLYTNKPLWIQCQKNGFEIIEKCYSKSKYSIIMMSRLNLIQLDITKHRATNFIGSMLLFHTMRSTEFMSRWIEEKNK